MSITKKDLYPVSEVQYYLQKLVSECSELIHVVSKIQEFGVDSADPLTQVSNLDAVQKEFNDILGVGRKLQTLGMNIYPDETLIEAKLDKMVTFSEKSRELGTLSREFKVTRARLVATKMELTDFLDHIALTPVTSADVEKLAGLFSEYPQTLKTLKTIVEQTYKMFPTTTFELKFYNDPEVGTPQAMLTIGLLGEPTPAARDEFTDWYVEQEFCKLLDGADVVLPF